MEGWTTEGLSGSALVASGADAHRRFVHVPLVHHLVDLRLKPRHLRLELLSHARLDPGLEAGALGRAVGSLGRAGLGLGGVGSGTWGRGVARLRLAVCATGGGCEGSGVGAEGAQQGRGGGGGVGGGGGRLELWKRRAGARQLGFGALAGMAACRT